ncbi:DUF2815 family protein [Pseudomonas sp. B14(2017)]|uniref:DUF2815 family protein n=1 Tax=Pseudomonas sp. B14(2017) TaxID=1981745 RepID=UPI000A1FDD0D|nr:DUF2815 family protein [Pseudomonas sp. B14(2017)]
MSNFVKRPQVITPRGTVEPYAYISKPDFGRDHFATERGKYKLALTIPTDEAQPLIDKIVKWHEESYARRLAEHKKNPPQVQRGKKPLLPYEGDLPFVENDDGTVTFRMSSYDRFEDRKTGKTVMKPLKVSDSRGKALAEVPNISGGSEVKVKLTLLDYGWTPTTGASVKLQIDAVMLLKLVEFGGGEEDWGDEVEEDGFVAEDAPARSEGSVGGDESDEVPFDQDDAGDF